MSERPESILTRKAEDVVADVVARVLGGEPKNFVGALQRLSGEVELAISLERQRHDGVTENLRGVQHELGLLGQRMLKVEEEVARNAARVRFLHRQIALVGVVVVGLAISGYLW